MKRKLLNISSAFAIGMLLIPATTNAYSFNEIKNTKSITVNSVKPTDRNHMFMVSEMFMNDGFGIIESTCNNDLTVCTFIEDAPTNPTKIEGVKITYKYDETVKKVADSIVKNIPTNGRMFYLNEIEAASYRYDNANYKPKTEYDHLNPIKYSSEYNKLIGYKNFVSEPRMGADTYVSHSMSGTALFNYNNTNYAFLDNVGASYNEILYIKENETNVEKYLKEKLSKYFSIKNVTKENKTINETINEIVNEKGDAWDRCIQIKNELANATETEKNTPEYSKKYMKYQSECSMIESGFYQSRQDYENTILNEDLFLNDETFGLYDCRNDDMLPNRYVVEFTNGTKLSFIVIKDSSKIFDGKLNFISSDASTGIEVNTNNLIPLDTLIQVAKLTNGDEYDKIVKLLKTDLVNVFDIKLFSKSSSKNITKLDNGNFEVKVPISEELKGKDLAVYYIDDNNNIEKYDVTIKDGYAIFTTTHFSVYTLAENTNVNSVETPKTGDNILIYTMAGLISLAGIITVLVITKKKHD